VNGKKLVLIRTSRPYAEHRAEEVHQRALQIRERDPTIDCEGFDLVKVRGGARTRGVPPIDTPERCDVDRRLTVLHHADLARGRVRSQQRLVVEIERSRCDREGCVSGWLSASKLCQTVSTSRLSTIS